MFTLAVHAAPPHNAAINIRLFLGGLRPPKPSQGLGPGCAGLRPASAEAWGHPVSPPPSPRAYVHVSRPCGSAAQRRNEHTVVPGRAKPSQTLPRVGEWGLFSRETVMRKARHARCKRPGSASGTPAPRLRGHGASPLPDAPSLGEGTRLLPPAGGGWEGGGTLRTGESPGNLHTSPGSAGKLPALPGAWVTSGVNRYREIPICTPRIIVL